MKKIIKNGIIVTAADTYTGDVAIENGVITEIAFIWMSLVQKL